MTRLLQTSEHEHNIIFRVGELQEQLDALQASYDELMGLCQYLEYKQQANSKNIKLTEAAFRGALGRMDIDVFDPFRAQGPTDSGLASSRYNNARAEAQRLEGEIEGELLNVYTRLEDIEWEMGDVKTELVDLETELRRIEVNRGDPMDIDI